MDSIRQITPSMRARMDIDTCIQFPCVSHTSRGNQKSYDKCHKKSDRLVKGWFYMMILASTMRAPSGYARIGFMSSSLISGHSMSMLLVL